MRAEGRLWVAMVLGDVLTDRAAKQIYPGVLTVACFNALLLHAALRSIKNIKGV
ncbi:hypothetical protein ACQEPB_03505 [Novosphingobium fluoreni]|uniref:hypothetical protein n=1 Tax=Novosphingobium fluoreni TaxID=1391222 RepID=UPI003DA10406